MKIDRIESLAETLHQIYQQEAKRQGDVRHFDDYAALSENVKEFDRVLARYVLQRDRDRDAAFLVSVKDAVNRGYGKWEADDSCHEPGCGCVTVWIEREIDGSCPDAAHILAERDAATVEQCRQIVMNTVPDGKWWGQKVRVREGISREMLALRPDAARTLARIRMEARIEEADFWEHTINAPGESISGEQRLADLKAKLANIEEENA